jgi:peptidylprolyl isomerase
LTPATAAIERPAILFETEAGPITVLLYPEAAPQTVALMQQYVAEGYYVGRSFGRTVPGHVIQVAEATETRDDARRVPLETNAAFHFSAGAVGTARGTDPGSGGPELFIMDYATSHLDGNYTVWGQVVSDLAAVHDIANRPAIDSSTVPSIPGAPAAAPFDRMAVVPVRITATHSIKVSLPAALVAQLPLQVAKNVRAGDLRHSLEFPADLHPGATSRLTWYIRGYNGAAAPTANLAVQDNATATSMPISPMGTGIYPFDWMPATAGEHVLSFVEGGTVLARLRVQVPAQAGAQVLG